MGRYSALQFGQDNEDVGQAMPMEWTSIPDGGPGDHSNDDIGHLSHGSHGGGGDYGSSGASLNFGRYLMVQVTKGRRAGADHDRNFGGEESKHIIGDPNEFSDHDGHLENADANANASNNCEAFLWAEKNLGRSNRYLERQQLSERKRNTARMRKILILAAATVVVVLKRHVPPPPPLWNLFPVGTASFSHDSDDTVVAIARGVAIEPPSCDNAQNMPSFMQHETWASYSWHCLYLVHRTLAYGMFVAWYAVSNAFCYALEELRESLISFGQGNSSGNDKRLWVIWKDKLIAAWSLLPKKDTRHNSQELFDTQHKQHEHREERVLDKISVCPIRLPAASNRDTHLPWGATGSDNDEIAMQGWSTEEVLRQTIGTSLSPQNLALKVLAEGLDSSGDSLVENAPLTLVRKMSTGGSAKFKDGFFVDDETMSSWILPPAKGFLLVGPEGSGKLNAARCLARLMFRHCSESSTAPGMLNDVGASIQELEGVFEVIAGNHDRDIHGQDPYKESIINHIHSRRGLGSIVIIHHIELLPAAALSEISHVLSRKRNTLSYRTPEEKHIEATCDGTVFVLTSKQWGTVSIFQHIQRYNGLMNMQYRESLISSIRWEVDSHLDHEAKLASYVTIAPFLPFQQDDIASIMQTRVHALDMKYRGLRWSRLEVSYAVIRRYVGAEYVEYLDLYDVNSNTPEEDHNRVLFTLSASGGHALDNNLLWQTLKTKLSTSTRRRPGFALKVSLDDKSKATIFKWCTIDSGGLEACEVEWW